MAYDSINATSHVRNASTSQFIPLAFLFRVHRCQDTAKVKFPTQEHDTMAPLAPANARPRPRPLHAESKVLAVRPSSLFNEVKTAKQRTALLFRRLNRFFNLKGPPFYT